MLIATSAKLKTGLKNVKYSPPTKGIQFGKYPLSIGKCSISTTFP